jgi:hypothetical protein
MIKSYGMLILSCIVYKMRSESYVVRRIHGWFVDIYFVSKTNSAFGSGFDVP